MIRKGIEPNTLQLSAVRSTIKLPDLINVKLSNYII